MAVVLLAACTAGAASKHNAGAPGAGLTPAAKIAVGPLGYIAPSDAYMTYRMALATVDFIDNDHLLFTFHSSGLMRRIPGDPADDQDQIIHAVVVNIASGKALRQADWRMHDRQRYLWALQNGKFLVRQRNSLFITDSSLELRPYLTFDTNLQAIEISPARELMLIETEKILPPEDGEADGSPTLFPSQEVRRKRTEIMLLRPGEKTVLGKGELRTPIDVPLLEDGLLDVEPGQQPTDWTVEKKPLHGDEPVKTDDSVGELKSSCVPELEVLSENVVLAQSCPVKGGSANAVSAISLMGGVLWQDVWQAKYVWPDFSRAENGSRFAYGSLETNRAIGTFDQVDATAAVAQPVGVFDTESGKLEMVRDATPILSGGHNFALSADGRRFAILREGSIEVYDLPPAPVNEAVKGKPEAKK